MALGHEASRENILFLGEAQLGKAVKGVVCGLDLHLVATHHHKTTDKSRDKGGEQHSRKKLRLEGKGSHTSVRHVDEGENSLVNVAALDIAIHRVGIQNRAHVAVRNPIIRASVGKEIVIIDAARPRNGEDDKVGGAKTVGDVTDHVIVVIDGGICDNQHMTVSFLDKTGDPAQQRGLLLPIKQVRTYKRFMRSFV